MAADVLLAGLKPDGFPGELIRFEVPDGRPLNLGRYGDGQGNSTFVKDTGEGEVHVFDGHYVEKEHDGASGPLAKRLSIVRHLFTVEPGERLSVHVYDAQKNKVRLTVKNLGHVSAKPLVLFGQRQSPQ